MRTPGFYFRIDFSIPFQVLASGPLVQSFRVPACFECPAALMMDGSSSWFPACSSVKRCAWLRCFISNAKSDLTSQFVWVGCGMTPTVGSTSSKQAFFVFSTRYQSRFWREIFLKDFLAPYLPLDRDVPRMANFYYRSNGGDFIISIPSTLLKALTSFDIKLVPCCTWIFRGTPWFTIYVFQNFMILSDRLFPQTIADGHREIRSNAPNTNFWDSFK